MKRFLFTLVVVFTSTITCYGQHNIEKGGYIIQDEYSYFSYDDYNGYTLNIKDSQYNEYITIHLGLEKESCFYGLTYFIDWFNNPEEQKAPYFTNDYNETITHYKVNEKFIKFTKDYSPEMKELLINKNYHKLTGYVSITFLENALYIITNY